MWFKNNKILLYVITISLLIIGSLAFYITWNNSNHNEEMLKAANKAKQKAQEEYIAATDSLISINKKLKEYANELESKPPIQIPRYYETIIYINVADSTIIRSVTKQTERYRAKQQEQLGN
tara:strand:+ start:1970 stop:2332 length:363 start_codon:yes stop_codon:yes gene_type:complete